MAGPAERPPNARRGEMPLASNQRFPVSVECRVDGGAMGGFSESQTMVDVRLPRLLLEASLFCAAVQRKS
jgi:hypothetical protein